MCIQAIRRSQRTVARVQSSTTHSKLSQLAESTYARSPEKLPLTTTSSTLPHNYYIRHQLITCSCPLQALSGSVYATHLRVAQFDSVVYVRSFKVRTLESATSFARQTPLVELRST